MSYKLYSTALGRMVDSSGKGDFTTITAATAAAVSGQTIFIKAGTYTEDFSPKDGVTYVAYNATSGNFGVKIVGKLSFSAAATCSFRGIYFQTNSDNIVSITGTGNVTLDFNNCYFNASNATAFSCTASAGTQVLNLSNSSGDLGTTGITWWVFTRGGVNLTNCNLSNGASSTTTSTFSNSSSLSARNCIIQTPVTTSDSAAIGMNNVSMRMGGGYNLTCLTINGSGSTDIEFCLLESGTASVCSVGASGVLEIYECTLDSTNTNIISGTGIVRFGGLTYTSSSFTIQSTLTLTERRGSCYGAQLALIKSQTASNSATIDFTNIGGYTSYMIVFESIVPDTAGSTLYLRTSNDNGSTWSSSGYQGGCNALVYSSSSNSNTNSTSSFPLCGSSKNSDANSCISGNAQISNCNLGNKATISGTSTYTDNGSSNAAMSFYGGKSAQTGVNALRFLMSSGNISSGVITLYGFKNKA